VSFIVLTNSAIMIQKKAIPSDLDWPWGFQELRLQEFQDNWHMKVLRPSVLSTGNLYPLPPPPGDTPGTHCSKKLSRPQGHSTAGRINLRKMKNPNDPIGKLDLCLTVHHQCR
jgi:hypothetical protein